MQEFLVLDLEFVQILFFLPLPQGLEGIWRDRNSTRAAGFAFILEAQSRATIRQHRWEVHELEVSLL